MNSGSKTVAIVLAVWFCLALGLGLSGLFRPASAPVIGATVWALAALALFLSWKVSRVRAWASVVDLRWLLGFHLLRLVAGIVFLVDFRAGLLAPAFARPAAYGDITVAVLAFFILVIPPISKSRRLLFFWNSLGLIDILFVVVNALRVGLRDWPGMAPLREFPLVLLPTFFVPLIIASHVLIFVRLAIRDSMTSE
jgi:hypothetical protein